MLNNQQNQERSRLISLIRQKIPALASFSFDIFKLDEFSTIISASLSDHLNHKGTAFGGSIYQLGLVSGYAQFLRLLESANQSLDHLVISHADIDYLLPIKSDFYAKTAITKKQFDDFLVSLNKKNRGHLVLEINIYSEENLVAAKMQARFVHAPIITK